MSATSLTLQHVGEWMIELRADSLEELFAELARVLARAGGPLPEPVRSGEWERLELEARDHAALLVDWANELIGRSEVEGRAYRDVRNLTIESVLPLAAGQGRWDAPAPGPIRLVAEVRGDLVDEWVSPVKAATYHGALLERYGNGWRGEVLLDV